MFQKILIANRGEIACRVAATARRMGVRSVAVYAEADAQARHVQACDEALPIGASAPQDSYLRWDKIIAAARATGAQAIHPGYGFLSENHHFAQACAEAGLVFVGPPPAAIQAMGRKAEAKQLMAQAGVPLVPGYHGSAQDPQLLATEAGRIGYPVLIKASAGGGGKGMRVVLQAEDFAAALASCQREARSSFGDDAVLIEKYLLRPRHVEVQVFADSQGHCVYLFDRDCSVQRRHQKVLEEAPAPGLSAALRQRMGAAAVAAAQAVGYVGAGTVEFIVVADPSPQAPDPHTFFFMEMNTRLQVEHPVTEAVTGLDLVEWQLRVAAGEPLPLTQAELRCEGHAIEARICAENPERDFLPATGALLHWQLPPHSAFERAGAQAGAAGVRVDSGVGAGDSVSPYYDAMLAKLIVHGDSRAQALARLDAALAQTRIVGLGTNVQFLRHVVQCPSFAQADLDTGLIVREQAVLFHQARVRPDLALAALVADTVQSEQDGVDAAHWTDPFARRDGWSAHGEQTRHWQVLLRGQPLQARLRYGHDGRLQLQVDGPQDAEGGAEADAGAGRAGELQFRRQGDALALSWQGQTQAVQVLRQGDWAHVFTPQGHVQLQVQDALAHAGESGHEGARLSAPMPGRVVSFAVRAGDAVKAGQVLAVMEAMKMEHSLAAPHDGVVAELLFAPGDQVGEGAELLRLSEASPAAGAAA